VGGGLGWPRPKYHKNINKTLILQNFRDDFCEELQIGDKIGNEFGASLTESLFSAHILLLMKVIFFILLTASLFRSYRQALSKWRKHAHWQSTHTAVNDNLEPIRSVFDL
jgi:hypothetical protein